MAEESESTSTSVEEPKTEETEPAPRRRRGRPSKAEQQAALPPFDPTMCEGRITVVAKRVVATGKFESFDLIVKADFERDPRYSVYECITLLSDLVTEKANSTAERIQREIGVEK